MKIVEVLSEKRVEPDWEFLRQLEPIVDDSIDENQEFLDSNNDVDDIDELEEILNGNVDEDLPIEFITDHNPRKDKDEWISAAADWTPDEGKFVTVYLHAKNLERVYGPKTFKDILMRMLQHETIHWNQYDKMDQKVLPNYQSGYMKGLDKVKKGGSERDLMRSYLRDPHELMAYGSDLAGEIKNLDNPEQVLRNPEAHRKQLPVYDRFRNSFPANSKQIKQLLKYTADYFQQGK